MPHGEIIRPHRHHNLCGPIEDDQPEFNEGQNSDFKEFQPKDGSRFTNATFIIAAHEPCKIEVTNPCYKIVCEKGNKFTNTNLEVIQDVGDGKCSQFNHSMCELAKYSYASEKLELGDYVGTCHYRRFFGFGDNIPDLDKLFSEYDVVCRHNDMGICKIFDQFRGCHDITNLLECSYYIPELFPDYTVGEIGKALNEDLLYICNMVIMKRDDFIKWVDFYTKVFERFCEYHNIHNDDDMKKYIKDCGENDVEYQSRLFGFIGERITNIFIRHNFKNVFVDKNPLNY